MLKPYIPICYHPTTILFIDDNTAFLNSMCNRLNTFSPCKSFDSPRKAADFLNNAQSITFQHNQSIYEVASSDARYREITTVLIDYQMPDMNGVTFCQGITTPDIKKIMLTGEADNQIAVDAFNQGVIDGFIRKSEGNLAQTITQKIQALQKQVFIDQSRELIAQLHQQEHKPICECFFDQDFAEWFYVFLEQHNIIEFYLYSTPANFMLLDSQGNVSWLCIATEEELNEDIEWAIDQFEDGEDKAAKPLANDLKHKHKMLFFPEHHANFKPSPFAKWDPYAHACEKLTLGNNTYYYALFSDQAPYTMPNAKITGFDDFMDGFCE